DTERGERLAAAALADQRERLSAHEREAHVLEHRAESVVAVESGAETFDREQRARHCVRAHSSTQLVVTVTWPVGRTPVSHLGSTYGLVRKNSGSTGSSAA